MNLETWKRWLSIARSWTRERWRRRPLLLRSFNEIPSDLQGRWADVLRYAQESPPRDDLNPDVATLLWDYSQRKFDDARRLFADLEARRHELMKFTVAVVAGYFAIQQATGGKTGWLGAGGAIAAVLAVAMLVLSGRPRDTDTLPPIESLRKSVHKHPTKPLQWHLDGLSASLALATAGFDRHCRLRSLHLKWASWAFLLAVTLFALSFSARLLQSEPITTPVEDAVPAVEADRSSESSRLGGRAPRPPA